MKEILFTSIIILATLVSCTEKDTIDPNTPVTTQYFTVTAIASQGGVINPVGDTSVKAGSSVTYNIVPDSNYSIKSVVVDGDTVPVYDNKYKFDYVMSNRKIKVDFVFDYSRLLNKRPWSLRSIDYYKEGKYLYSLNLNETPDRLTDKYFYYLDGNYEVKHENGSSFGSGTWSISPDGKVFTECGGTQEVVELSDTLFVRINSHNIDPIDGKTTYAKDTYWR